MPAIFNGSTSKVSFNAPADVSDGPLSLVFWYYTTTTTGNRYIFHRGPGGSFRHFWHFTGADGRLFCTRVTTGTAANLTSSIGVQEVGKWKHYAITSDGGSGFKLYVNGVEDTGAVVVPPTGTELAGGVWSVGCRDFDDARTIDGKFHKYRIWNRVLSASEVLNDYNNTAEPSSANLLVKFDYDADTADSAGLIASPTISNLTLTNTYPRVGLAAWFRANDVAGSPVASMTDRAGNSATVSQATLVNQPNLYSGSYFPTKLASFEVSATAADSHCLSLAAGTGPTFDAQNMTVYVVGACCYLDNANSPNDQQTILAIGDPSTANSGIFELRLEPPGLVIVRRTKTTAVTRTCSGITYTSNPRVWAFKCSASELKVFVEHLSESLSALTADTATGMRIGADLGTVADGATFDLAELRIYQAAHTDAQVASEIASLRAAHGLSAPTKTLIVEGSSSANGFASTGSRGLVRPMYPTAMDGIIYVMAQGGDTFTQFDSDLTANIAPLVGATNLPVNFYLWLGANDMSSASDNGAAIFTELADYIAALRSNGTIGPRLRRIAVSTLLPSATNVTREASRLTFNAAVRGMSGVRVADIASISSFVVANSASPASIATVTSGSLYNADTVHLNEAGFAEIANTVVISLRAQSVSQSTAANALLRY